MSPDPAFSIQEVLSPMGLALHPCLSHGSMISWGQEVRQTASGLPLAPGLPGGVAILLNSDLSTSQSMEDCKQTFRKVKELT